MPVLSNWEMGEFIASCAADQMQSKLQAERARQKCFLGNVSSLQQPSFNINRILNWSCMISWHGKRDWWLFTSAHPEPLDTNKSGVCFPSPSRGRQAAPADPRTLSRAPPKNTLLTLQSLCIPHQLHLRVFRQWPTHITMQQSNPEAPKSRKKHLKLPLILSI